MKKILIIGTGWAGASASYKLESLGHKTTLIEKANVVGGHSRSEIKNEVIYEPNGPHIFHTSKKRVNEYVNNFGMKRKYKHEIKSRIYPESLKGESILVSWPPQVEELKKLNEWDVIKNQLNSLPKTPNSENFETYAISIMGRTLYDLFIYGYTKKQWDLEPNELSSSFAPKRIDLRTDGFKGIFKDKWEYFHPEGSGVIIERILEDKEVLFNTRVDLNNIGEFIAGYDGVIITAALDDFSNSSEKLLWRGIKSKPEYFENIGHQEFKTESYQINHPSMNEEYTRTVETKHASGQQIKGTIVCKEYSYPNIRHYPVLKTDDNNLNLNNSLKKIIKSEVKIPTFFTGRLANYKYINQDEAIESAFRCAEQIYEYFE